MKQVLLMLFACLAALLISGCSNTKQPSLRALKSAHVTTFQSQADFENYMEGMHQLRRYRETERSKQLSERYPEGVEFIEVTGSRIDSSDLSITNNQVDNVDEGGIIKFTGDYLIILRKGVIYSVKITENSHDLLYVKSKIEINQSSWNQDVWYDELLVLKDTLLVLGYNYGLDASQLLRFNLGSQGEITYRDGILIKSDDYFSSSNYGSRIINNKYLTYLPIELTSEYSNQRKVRVLPQFARITDKGFSALEWQNIIGAKDIYKSLDMQLSPILHTVITCDPLTVNFDCGGKAVVGSDEYEYFVSNSAFYLWTSILHEDRLTDFQYWGLETQTVSRLFKVPHSGGVMGTVKVKGKPSSQFSFMQSEDALHLLTVSEEHSIPEISALLYKLPDILFGQSSEGIVKPWREWSVATQYINNRFTNEWLVLGEGLYRDEIETRHFGKLGSLSLTHLLRDEQLTFDLPHTVDRIEPIGEKLFVSGVNLQENYNVSIINLADRPSIDSEGVFDSFLEKENISHAFNYKSVSDNYGIAGITALNKASLTEATEDDLSIVYLGVTSNAAVSLAGQAKAKVNPQTFVDCEVSCSDWYGNSRPFYIGNRVFALVGDVLIESQIIDDQVIELERVDYVHDLHMH
ncbi:beta-propeller domain-containing protein [Pseudoalteromonas luteoviolacea]|uniref:Uncharacterized protein n=1 Tax=Pseudoalteromonas luteoviolacea NCIMB 1942 TaxID=1365253 RepID=A0A166Z5J9_9GAMM|nr:beta-propeller domain-containing protein [Pseudoalteromonas luteoviolacea]KZN43957.1 hypothetical protein N482_18160 [Pseudoalteromonas luteoviolacea NCIMB 1942]